MFSLYVTTSLGNLSRILQQDNYQKARESIIDRGVSYLQDYDVFNRLVPFWQLHRYEMTQQTLDECRAAIAAMSLPQTYG